MKLSDCICGKSFTSANPPFAILTIENPDLKLNSEFCLCSPSCVYDKKQHFRIIKKSIIREISNVKDYLRIKKMVKQWNGRVW